LVNQDPAHHLGRQREEVRAILPISLTLVDQSQVRFVDQGRRLERVPWPLAPEAGCRPAAELLIDDRDQLVPSGEIAPAPRV
jgi:hypothetical protein